MMEKINNFLNNIYSNNQSLMYFYIVLGIIAMFFIILIIITLANSSKEKKKNKAYVQNEVNKETNEVKEASEEVVEEDKEEPIITENAFPLEEETPVAETPPVEVAPVAPLPVEEPTAPTEEPVKEEDTIEKVELSAFPEDTILAVDTNLKEEEVKEEPLTNTMIKESFFEDLNNKMEPKTTSDVYLEKEDGKPLIEDFKIDSMEETEEPKEIEIPGIDEDLFTREETSNNNEDLKSRLELLKEKKKEEILNEDLVKDGELENLMKAVGLEDTMVIPKLKDEEDVLGK